MFVVLLKLINLNTLLPTEGAPKAGTCTCFGKETPDGTGGAGPGRNPQHTPK